MSLVNLPLTRQQLQRCAQLTTRPGWHGSYHVRHRRCVKAAKRQEAIDRNAVTVPERRSRKVTA